MSSLQSPVQSQGPDGGDDLLQAFRRASGGMEAGLSADEAFDAASKEVYGFFPVAGQWTGRAARAIADASIRTVDRVGYGYSLLWQHANNLVGQMPSLARPGERVQDQPGWELPQAIHPVSAATGAPDADVLDVAHSLGLVDNASDIRKAQSEKLGNWEASAAIAGELASYAIPGTPIHGIGAGLGNLARNAVGMALPASRYLKALVDKGTITADRAEEIARSGNVLYEIAKHESSGLAVKTLAKAPSFAGDYAAMLGQSYASAPAPEADDVLKHTALMAPMFLGIGRVAQMASSRIAEATLSDAGKRAMLDLYAATQKGKTPGLWKTIAALPGADKAKILSTELMLAGAEGTAFTATNIEAYNDLLDAYAGKPGSWNQFMQTWSGTMAGTLFNKGVPWAELPYFKRVRPDLNSYQTILDQEAAAARAKSDQEAASAKSQADAERAKQEARDDTTKRGVEAGKLYGEARAAADKEFDANVQMESMARREDDRTVASFVDPLLRSASGLVVEHAAPDQPIPEVKVVDPSGASVTLRPVAPGNVASRTVEPSAGEAPTIRPTEPEAFVDVSRKAWNAVRPGEPMPDGPLTGSDANRFLNDLGIHLVGQSARGTLIFGGRLGMLENSAGGGWRDPGKGRDYTFGLDGEPLFRDVMDKRWRPLEETDPVRWMMDEPVGALGGDQSFWHPAMDEWARFLHQKARAYPNPEVDSLLAIVMNVAQYGGNSKPADEARNFLLSVEPALVAQAMTQGNEKAIAHTIAATAAGLSNHQEAQRLIAEAARLGSRDRALVPKEATTPQEPAKTEPPPEVGITELFGGIPLKGVGDALRRFADLVVSGDPDAAQGRARERAAAEDQPKPGFGVKDKYAANIGEVVGRYGGEVGKQIEADVFMANNAYREVQGKLAESGYFDDVRKMAGRKGYSEAAKWLDTEVADPQQEGTTTSRRNLLLEGIAVDEPTPPKAQELLDAYGKAFHLLGQEAESAGIVRPNREGGYERFRAREPGRTLATRTDTTEAYRDIVERPFDPRSAEALRQIALHPRNKMSPEQADAWVKRVQDEWSKAKTAPNDVKSLMEVRRELPFLPDTVTVQGEKIRLREKSGAVAMAKMVEAGLRSIRSHIAFGPDIPKAAKEALGDKSLGPTETLRRYAEATGNDTKAQEALQVLLNRVEGRSEDPFFPKWGGRSRKLLRDLETATRVAMISGSYKQNFVEAIGTGSHLTGMQRGVPAMLKAGFSPVATLHEAARVGAVMHGVHGTDITMHNGVLKAVTAVMGLPHSASQSFAEATAYAMVKSYADSIRKNGIDAVAESRMRMVGMPELVIAKAKENFTPDMEAAFVRAAVREMTGSKTPTEGSYYASNPKFQTLFAFNKWFTSRLRGLFKVGDEMFKAWKSGDASAKYAATLNAIQFAAGSTVAGMIGSYLGMVMKEQSFEEAYDRIMRELAVDGVPYGLLKLGFAPSLIGGVLGSMARSALDPNMSAAEQVASLTTPGARATQLIAMAKGEGSYRDQDAGSRIITSLERIAPISGDLKAIGAVMGLTEQEGPFRAANSAKYRAMRDLGYPIPTGGGEDPEDVPFHTAMRKLDQFIKERAATKTAKEIVQEPEFTDLAREALGVGQGKDIAASLLARQSLSGFDEQRLEKIRQRVGDANMGVLFAHDRAMEVLAKAFRKEKGTDRHLYPPIAERLDSAEEMVRLGDTGGVWKPIYTEVMEEAVAAVRSGVRPSHDLRRAAISMSRHPESLRGIVSDEKIAVLRRVSAARAAQLLERFFLESVERRLTR